MANNNKMQLKLFLNITTTISSEDNSFHTLRIAIYYCFQYFTGSKFNETGIIERWSPDKQSFYSKSKRVHVSCPVTHWWLFQTTAFRKVIAIKIFLRLSTYQLLVKGKVSQSISHRNPKFLLNSPVLNQSCWYSAVE